MTFVFPKNRLWLVSYMLARLVIEEYVEVAQRGFEKQMDALTDCHRILCAHPSDMCFAYCRRRKQKGGHISRRIREY